MIKSFCHVKARLKKKGETPFTDYFGHFYITILPMFPLYFLLILKSNIPIFKISKFKRKTEPFQYTKDYSDDIIYTYLPDRRLLTFLQTLHSISGCCNANMSKFFGIRNIFF